MSIESTILQRDQLLRDTGKLGMNVAFPNDFELYMFALELLSSDGRTLEYLIFPVNPKNIKIQRPEITKIEKTASGVQVIKSDGFIPYDINLSGNFGRSFKVMLGATSLSLIQHSTPTFNSSIKNGYGVTKLLEGILLKSKEYNERDGIRRLVLHTLAFNNSSIVEPTSSSFLQDEQNNMIWNYDISFKAIAPLSSLYTRKQRTVTSLTSLGRNILQSRVNRAVSEGFSTLSSNEIKILRGRK